MLDHLSLSSEAAGRPAARIEEDITCASGLRKEQPMKSFTFKAA